MINPLQIIGWWFIGGIVASPVILAVWWVVVAIKAELEEIVRLDREQRERIERLEIIRAELEENIRLRQSVLLHYNAGGGRCGGN